VAVQPGDHFGAAQDVGVVGIFKLVRLLIRHGEEVHLLAGKALEVILEVGRFFFVVQDEKAGTRLLLEGHGTQDRIETAHRPLYLEVLRPVRREGF
jgi:hypothetical protein